MSSTWLLIPAVLSAIGANQILARRTDDPRRRRFHRRAAAFGVVLLLVLVTVTALDLLEWAGVIAP